MRMSILFAIYSSHPRLLMPNVSVIFISLHNPIFYYCIPVIECLYWLNLKEESNHKFPRCQCVQQCPSLMSKFSDSGSKNLYFPYLKVKNV